MSITLGGDMADPADDIKVRMADTLGVQAATQKLFGKDFNQVAHHIYGAAGAIPGSTVTIQATRDGHLYVSTSHPHMSTSRVFRKGRDGKLEMEAMSQAARGPLLGKGHERFHKVLGHLRTLGVHRIMTDAMGSKGGDGNGYYTWPRFGFNGEIERFQMSALPVHIQRAMSGDNDFHTLFSIPGKDDEPGVPDHELSGAGAWKRFGSFAPDLEFQVHPNSPHSQLFEDYHAARTAKAGRLSERRTPTTGGPHGPVHKTSRRTAGVSAGGKAVATGKASDTRPASAGTPVRGYTRGVRRFSRFTLGEAKPWRSTWGGNGFEHDYFDEAGNKAGVIRVQERNDGDMLHIHWAGPTDASGGDAKYANRSGVEAVRSLHQHLADAYPKAKFLSGIRAGGPKKGQRVVVALRKSRPGTVKRYARGKWIQKTHSNRPGESYTYWEYQPSDPTLYEGQLVSHDETPDLVRGWIDPSGNIHAIRSSHGAWFETKEGSRHGITLDKNRDGEVDAKRKGWMRMTAYNKLMSLNNEFIAPNEHQVNSAAALAQELELQRVEHSGKPVLRNGQWITSDKTLWEDEKKPTESLFNPSPKPDLPPGYKPEEFTPPNRWEQKHEMKRKVKRYSLPEAMYPGRRPAPGASVDHTDADFHRKIHENPGEATNWLAWADFLDEQGKPILARAVRDHAEFFRKNDAGNEGYALASSIIPLPPQPFKGWKPGEAQVSEYPAWDGRKFLSFDVRSAADPGKLLLVNGNGFKDNGGATLREAVAEGHHKAGSPKVQPDYEEVTPDDIDHNKTKLRRKALPRRFAEDKYKGYTWDGAAWMDPEGNVYPVMRLHTEWVADNFQNHPSLASVETLGPHDDLVNEAMKNGWVRMVKDGNTLWTHNGFKPITRKQVDSAILHAVKHGMTELVHQSANKLPSQERTLWTKERYNRRQNKMFHRRFAKVDGDVPAHHLVAGFPLEHMLRKVANDPNNHGPVRDAAHIALTGRNRMTGEVNDHSVSSALWQLHDLIRDHGYGPGGTTHPDQDKYNWMAAGDKVFLDAHTHTALHEEAEHMRREHGEPVRRQLQWAYRPEGQAIRVTRDIGSESKYRTTRSSQALNRVRHRVAQLSGETDQSKIDESIKRHAARANMVWRREHGVDIKDDVEKSTGDETHDTDQYNANHKVTRYTRPEVPVKYKSAARGDFIQALRLIKSSNQKSLHAIAKAAAAKLGIGPGGIEVMDGLHDTPRGSVPGVVQAVYADIPPEKLHEAAVWPTLTGNLPGTAIFHLRGGGTDTLHQFRQEGSGRDIRQKLDRDGLTDRVLIPVPGRSSFDILISDRGSKLGRQTAKYAQTHGLVKRSSRGFFKTIGSQDQGKARDQMRKTVVKSEQGTGV